MHLIILGSGTSIPLRDRGSPALVLLVGDSPVLFDMGPGTLRQLTRVGLSCERIERVFLTHFHPDHTADLIHFLFASMNPDVLKRRLPFVIAGPAGVAGFIKRLQDAYPGWLTLPSGVMSIEEIDPLPRQELDCGGFTVVSSPTNHTVNSLAYRVEVPGGKTFVYSGDTGFCDEVVDLARGADLLVLESSFPEGEEVEGHLSPYLAGRMAALAGVKRLVLTHFYPQCLENETASQCRKSYDGELVLGRDLLRIRV